MGYQVSYEEIGVNAKRMHQKTKRKIFAGIGLLLFVLVMLSNFLEIDWVQRFLFPGDRELLGNALEAMVQMLQDGEDISTAISAFCRDVIGFADGTVLY